MTFLLSFTYICGEFESLSEFRKVLKGCQAEKTSRPLLGLLMTGRWRAPRIYQLRVAEDVF